MDAALSYPYDVDVTPDGILYIADTDGMRIRRVDGDGTITTLAGTGDLGDVGDGGPATAAMVNTPYGLVAAQDGTLYLSGMSNRVRRVLPAKPVKPGQEFLIPAVNGMEIFRFDAQGRHLSTQHALTGAELLTFRYDTQNRLTQVTDAYGNTTTIQRDGEGVPVAFVGPYGHRSVLHVNADGYLSSITNPEAQTVRLDYTGDGLMTSFTDPANREYQFPYDASGLLDGGSDPAGGGSGLSKVTEPGGSRVTRTSAEGRTSTYRFENLSMGGQRRVITRTDGTQVTVLKDILENVKREGSTVVDLPSGAEITEILGPDPRFGMQKPILQTRILDIPYKGANLRSTVEGAQNAVLTNPDDPFSLETLTSEITRNGRSYTEVFEAAGRTFTATSPQGRRKTREIDANGRTVTIDHPAFGRSRYAYDAQGRLIKATRQADGQTRESSITYDANGFVATVTDPMGRTIASEHDSIGRITLLTRPDGEQVSYEYDVNGNTTGVVPPDRPIHRFSHTVVDLPEVYTAPAVDGIARETRFQYNRDRQRTQIEKPDGRTVNFSFNAAGKLVSSRVTPEGREITWSYDSGTGQPTKVTGPDGISQGFEYYGSLLASNAYEGQVSGKITRSYDQDLRLVQLEVETAPHSMVFQYDDDSLLTGIGPDSATLALERAPDSGLITGSHYGNAPYTVADTRLYNGFGELTGYVAQCNGSSCYEVHVARDGIGRITEKVETVNGTTSTRRYTYNLAGHLTEVRDENDTLIASYSYDANGNRLSYHGPLGNATGTYDSQDRLVTYGEGIYTYSDNGDLIQVSNGLETTTFAVDGFGNLNGVTLPDGRRIDYLVDSANHRMVKKIDGIRVRAFLYAGGINPVAEVDDTDKVVSLFLYGSRSTVPELILRDDGNGTFVPYRVITDIMNSPILVIDAQNGTDVAQEMRYDEFGRVTFDSNPGFQPFGFAGGLYDPDTGLTRFGFREYDAVTGRWTAKDPFAFFGGDTNLYVYAFNDPQNLSDPAGLKPTLAMVGGDRSYGWVNQIGDTVYDWLKKKWNELSWDGMTTIDEGHRKKTSIAQDLNPYSGGTGNPTLDEDWKQGSQNFINWCEKQVGDVYQVTTVQERIMLGPQDAHTSGFSNYFTQHMSADLSVSREQVQNMINSYAEEAAGSPEEAGQIVEQLNYIVDYDN